MSLNIRLTNEFLMNPDFCTMKNSFEIQGKLSELKKWLNNNIEWDGLQGGLDNIKDTTKCLILHSIILEQKNNYIQNIENICPSLNLLQIKTLFQNFKADEIDTRQITNGDLNSFVEFIKQQANPNLDRVIIKNNESDVNLNDKNENSNNDDGSDGGDDGGDGDGDGDGDDEDDGDDESDESEKDDDEKDQIKIKENTVISTNIDFQFTFYEDWKDINPSNKLLSISAFKIVFESIDKILSSQNLN
ncbi:myosin-7 [Anaeramoeba flamelloides]|uniref:Myosin-7 n=1 Tax=Anaeramoeba flamelloides TaxID=1746091 RepID=A0ABQ8Z7N5_9EUKA|nr:myosin-7 [Anaeramoeba flamelloides]